MRIEDYGQEIAELNKEMLSGRFHYGMQQAPEKGKAGWR